MNHEDILNQLISEAKESYAEYLSKTKSKVKLNLNDYIKYYVELFYMEESVGIKEKYILILNNEIKEAKKDIEYYRNVLNFDSKYYANLSFENLIDILLDDECSFSHNDQLYMLEQYYFNNVRNIETEYNFLIQLQNSINDNVDLENGVPSVLLEFYEKITMSST